MSPHDRQRCAKFISDFVEGSAFERPFHLVCIDSRGSTSVTRYGPHGIEQVCSGPAKGNRLRMLPAAGGDVHFVGRDRQVSRSCLRTSLPTSTRSALVSGAMAGIGELVQEMTAVVSSCLATATCFDGQGVLRAGC